MKRKYAKKEDIPAADVNYYVEREGVWHFKGFEDDDTPGGGGNLDKERLKEFRDSNIALQQRLETQEKETERIKKQYEGVDVENYRKFTDQISKLSEEEEKELLKAGKINDVVSRRTSSAIAAKDAELKATQVARDNVIKEANTLKAKLGMHVIERQMKEEIVKQGLKLRDTAEEDILLRTNRVWQINSEGKEVAVDPGTGKTIYGETGGPILMSEFVRTHLLGKAPHLFMSAQGGGGAGGDATPPADGIIRIKRDDQKARSQNIELLAKGKAIVVD